MKTKTISKDVLAIILSCAKKTVMNPSNIYDIHLRERGEYENKKTIRTVSFTYHSNNGDYLDVEITPLTKVGLYYVYIDKHANKNIEHWYDDIQSWYPNVESLYAWIKSDKLF